MNAHTPMLQQYYAAKAEHPGVLLAMRVGDFYEFYGSDAETAAAVLEITLTGREDGPNGKIAMAGVPFHSVDKYLARLVQKGHKVAICDQLEDPKTAKGLVRRGVTRVLSPGTLVEDSMLSAGQNNYLAALCIQTERIGFAFLDPSTGEFSVTEMEGGAARDILLQELARIRPTELLVGKDSQAHVEAASEALGTAVTETDTPSPERAAQRLLQRLHATNLAGFGCEDKPAGVVAASMILAYAEQNHLPLEHVDSLNTYWVDGFMRLDPSTRRSLELTQNLTDGGRRYTLLSILDRTQTPMGARLLRRWIEQPLLDAAVLGDRHDAVERLVQQGFVRDDLRTVLGRCADLERLVSRCATELAGPRDLASLRSTLQALPDLEAPLQRVALGRLQEIREIISTHEELARLLGQALVSEPPHSIRDGGAIAQGYDLELDKLRDLSTNGKTYIAGLEAEERQQTGITNLKVGFNSVFGYYLEVGKSHIDRVPSHYIRKQTTANAERYITAELKEHESLVLGAVEKSTAIEVDLFQRLRRRVAEHSKALLQTAKGLAEIDVLASLAEVASSSGYCKPKLSEEDVLDIRGGRHPVVETTSRLFVPNDLSLDPTVRVLILTGPNMAGKSTYLRQTALIVLMAQIGSFVPAESCRMGLCDRIFARIGAKDELAVGQSTFMVEMVESANILNHATARSLVILDEVGRGTSTFDGLAIAWAMVEHLAQTEAKTLFATHYHQLNQLADQIPVVANFRVAVDERGDEIVWTHRVLPGGTERSYGIHVARMAGVPRTVLERAQALLAELEARSDAPRTNVVHRKLQMTLFDLEEPEVVQALRGLDLNRLTPMDALLLLNEWKRSVDGGQV